MNKFPHKLYSSGWLLSVLCLIAACQAKVEKPGDISLNKYADSTLVQIYDYQDKRDTKELLAYFNHENSEYRMAAAEAFGSVQDSLAIPMLGQLLYDSSAQVRKAAAYALGQSYDSSAVVPLTRALQDEDSVFVRRELLEALGKVVTQPQIQLLYNQPDASVKEKEGLAWGLYRAGIRNVHDGVAVRLGVSLLDSAHSYETRLGAAHFLARGKNLELKRYETAIIKAATSDVSPNVRMAAATALRNIQSETAINALVVLAKKDADYRVRVNALRALSAFNFDQTNTVVYESLGDENLHVAITAAGVIDAQATADDEPFITETALAADSSKVKAMLLGTALRLAEDKAPIAHFEGTEEEEVTNEYNHPIDWELVKSLTKDQKMMVETGKGNIELRLLVEEAPGSVANFVSLAQKGYFNGKNFHRVVPNFVVQGGCNRGDGYGGEDYSIRSELANLRYAEGSVGMASAGKDTEGTQWFITHSPTPHLDGRYTIFAQVTDGMDVVHRLQVGDTIQSVSLIK
ncbi:hypothetical protein GCM10009122_16160 [Fulvivirga kasyanovii]|uniref:peptidylprolyl isomerase n=2 Tax=Fulvivirga kasyanovii TaxID=396812 RepID=A0ABW9RJ85_9BACT|nr:hypothetical protein [Fulvivirga kasyanovii]